MRFLCSTDVRLVFVMRKRWVDIVIKKVYESGTDKYCEYPFYNQRVSIWHTYLAEVNPDTAFYDKHVNRCLRPGAHEHFKTFEKLCETSEPDESN